MRTAEVTALEPMGYLEVLVEAARFERPTYVVRVYETAFEVHGELVLKGTPSLKYLCVDHLREVQIWPYSVNDALLRKICNGELYGRDIVGVLPRTKRWCSKCGLPKKAMARYDPARPYKFQPLR